jgi:hypothetical protein
MALWLAYLNVILFISVPAAYEAVFASMLKLCDFVIVDKIYSLYIFCINPLILVSVVAAYYDQLLYTQSRPDQGALSIYSLGLQAAIFAAVAISRTFWLGSQWHTVFDERYEQYGWFFVDNVVVAMIQGVLWFHAWKTKTVVRTGTSEFPPLLAKCDELDEESKIGNDKRCI